jgi:D-aminopeptidase
MGGLGENSSGDIFFAFATGNRGLGGRETPLDVRMLPNEGIDPLFEAVVDATEEAILNALLAAETMTGRDGHTVEALDPSLLREALTRRP